MVGRLLGVEPRHLAALAAVGEHGSFKAAAQQLGYVQSAISQQIAQLERLIGTPLVARARGQTSVALSAEGTLLVSHAQAILAQLDAAAADLRALAQPEVEIRVGICDDGICPLVLGTLTALAQREPDVRIVMCDDTSADQQSLDVRHGVIDAAFADLPLNPGPFTYREVLRDPVVLVTQADSLLAHRAEPPTLEDLASVPLIVDPSWRMTELLKVRMRAAGMAPTFVKHADLTTSIQAFVASGFGAALMPRLAVDDGDERIAALSLEGLIPDRRVALYWHADRRQIDGLEALCDAVLSASAHLEPAERFTRLQPVPAAA